MTTSPAELDRFLADLSGRRQRLLRLVGPAAAPVDVPAAREQEADQDVVGLDLVAELYELSEQLIVADEELRVQQEELDATRSHLQTLVSEREALFDTSSSALVLTDDRGVVLKMSRVAAALVRHPPRRQAPRPIATWFEVADRHRVRNLISGRGLVEPLSVREATLRRSDGSTAVVDVRVSLVDDLVGAGTRLRWELAVTDDPRPAAPVPEPGSGSALAAELTEMTSRLAAVTSVPETLAAVADEAVRLVPGAENALLVVLGKQGSREILARAGGAPEHRTADELAVSLVLPGYAAVELRLQASRPETFEDEARRVAELLAVHFRVAVSRALQRQNLEQTIETRQQIGEAVGVLVERRRMTSAAAFDELVQQSQLLNLKLREVARIVVETGQDPDQISTL